MSPPAFTFTLHYISLFLSSCIVGRTESPDVLSIEQLLDLRRRRDRLERAEVGDEGGGGRGSRARTAPHRVHLEGSAKGAAGELVSGRVLVARRVVRQARERALQLLGRVREQNLGKLSLEVRKGLEDLGGRGARELGRERRERRAQLRAAAVVTTLTRRLRMRSKQAIVTDEYS